MRKDFDAYKGTILNRVEINKNAVKDLEAMLKLNDEKLRVQLQKIAVLNKSFAEVKKNFNASMKTCEDIGQESQGICVRMK